MAMAGNDGEGQTDVHRFLADGDWRKFVEKK